jgi:hypothetical protein
MATASAYVGTGANNNDGGNLGWTNPTNFQGDTTSTAATIALATNGHVSQQLRGTNFGFAIPTGSTILGIQAAIEAGSANNNRTDWHTVQLLKAAGAVGSNLSTGAAINTKATTNFGGGSNLWGTSWTAEDINDSAFGVIVKVTRTGATTTSMYRCQITVTYVPPSPRSQAILLG